VITPLTNHRSYAGGFGQGLTTGVVNMPGGARGAAQVGFGADYLPVVKVESFSGAQTRTGASASGFQSFTYNGAEAINLALVGRLHFVNSFDNPGSGEAGEGFFGAHLSIRRISDFAGINASTTAEQYISQNQNLNFGDCNTGSVAKAGFLSEGYSGDNNVNVMLNQTCSGGAILVNPGDQFVVIATMQAISNRGGFVDAMHTFEIEYDLENTVFVASGERVGSQALADTMSAAIPEPATWAMMILGLGAVGSVIRRRRALPA
jgi:hypothetical protein